jgi:hypothetical protein
MNCAASNTVREVLDFERSLPKWALSDGNAVVVDGGFVPLRSSMANALS